MLQYDSPEHFSEQFYGFCVGKRSGEQAEAAMAVAAYTLY